MCYLKNVYFYKKCIYFWLNCIHFWLNCIYFWLNCIQQKVCILFLKQVLLRYRPSNIKMLSTRLPPLIYCTDSNIMIYEYGCTYMTILLLTVALELLLLSIIFMLLIMLLLCFVTLFQSLSIRDDSMFIFKFLIFILFQSYNIESLGGIHVHIFCLRGGRAGMGVVRVVGLEWWL